MPARPLDKVVLVLYQPQEIGNVGAIIRVMSNYGLSRLRLVEPAAWDPWRLTAFAHDQHRLVEAAQHFGTLEDAIADCGWVIGTSARSREPYREPLTPRGAAPLILKTAADNPQTPVAILFGREDEGLPRQAMDQCHSLLTIPTDTANPSLNLAQAALVIAYELWMASSTKTLAAPDGYEANKESNPVIGADQDSEPAVGTGQDNRLAVGAEREAMFQALAELIRTLQPRIRDSQLEKAISRMRAVLLRAIPREDEARMVARLFDQITQRLRHQK